MQHLLVCPMVDTVCSPQHLTTANNIAIGCARHCEGTISQTYDSWWKDKNDDEGILWPIKRSFPRKLTFVNNGSSLRIFDIKEELYRIYPVRILCRGFPAIFSVIVSPAVVMHDSVHRSDHPREWLIICLTPSDGW